MLLVPELTQQTGEHHRRIGEHPAIHARMHIAAGVGKLDIVIEQSAQTIGDRRGIAVPHMGVTDQHDVSLELALVLFEKGREIHTADFLFALDKHRHRAGQFPRSQFPGTQGF